MYDVIIIGSGPAGLAAAIYAKRAALETLVLEKTPLSGGQIIIPMRLIITRDYRGSVAWNWDKRCVDMSMRKKQEIKTATVTAIEDKQGHKVVHTNQGDFETRTVVLAHGSIP